ncbi:MAG: hypothetical protein CR977_03555 [Gammaproteobacteria bacterium]|nr:MAG: hypothetical protein CR977_03555 [Gammaproteobacteria bacterium]
MKRVLLLLTLGFSLTAIAKDSATVVADDVVAPSADFIELTEAYQNRPKIAPENNAFIYLVGLTAPEDTDPMAFGQKIIDRSNQKIANGGESDTPEPKAAYSIPCTLAKHQELAREIIHNKAILLKRRQTLLTLPDYQNTMTIDLLASVPYYGSNIRLQQLALIDLWLNRNNYAPEKIKQALQKDYSFRLRQSANASTLLEKMVALAGLRHNYYWLNEILKSVDSGRAAALTPRYLETPIPASALSMRMAYIGELQFYISLFKPQNADDEFNLASQLSDNEKQRLFNYKATLLKRLIHISESNDFQQQLKQLEADNNIQKYLELMTALDKDSGGKLREFAFGDTPFEQFVLLIAKYIERPYELTAIQKAVKVLQAIRQQAIEPVNIPAFLQQSEQHNPLTQKSFAWDSDKQRIMIKTAEGQVYYLAL